MNRFRKKVKPESPPLREHQPPAISPAPPSVPPVLERTSSIDSTGSAASRFRLRIGKSLKRVSSVSSFKRGKKFHGDNVEESDAQAFARESGQRLPVGGPGTVEAVRPQPVYSQPPVTVDHKPHAFQSATKSTVLVGEFEDKATDVTTASSQLNGSSPRVETSPHTVAPRRTDTSLRQLPSSPITNSNPPSSGKDSKADSDVFTTQPLNRTAERPANAKSLHGSESVAEEHERKTLLQSAAGPQRSSLQTSSSSIPNPLQSEQPAIEVSPKTSEILADVPVERGANGEGSAKTSSAINSSAGREAFSAEGQEKITLPSIDAPVESPSSHIQESLQSGPDPSVSVLSEARPQRAGTFTKRHAMREGAPLPSLSKYQISPGTLPGQNGQAKPKAVIDGGAERVSKPKLDVPTRPEVSIPRQDRSPPPLPVPKLPTLSIPQERPQPLYERTEELKILKNPPPLTKPIETTFVSSSTHAPSILATDAGILKPEEENVKSPGDSRLVKPSPSQNNTTASAAPLSKSNEETTNTEQSEPEARPERPTGSNHIPTSESKSSTASPDEPIGFGATVAGVIRVIMTVIMMGIFGPRGW